MGFDFFFKVYFSRLRIALHSTPPVPHFPLTHIHARIFTCAHTLTSSQLALRAGFVRLGAGCCSVSIYISDRIVSVSTSVCIVHVSCNFRVKDAVFFLSLFTQKCRVCRKEGITFLRRWVNYFLERPWLPLFFFSSPHPVLPSLPLLPNHPKDHP